MIKKAVWAWIVVLTVAVAAAVWVLPGMARDRIERELQNVFKDARVSVGRLSIEWPPALAVADVRVEADGYSVRLPHASVDPALKLLLTEPRIRIQKIPSGSRPAGVAAAAPAPVFKSPFSALEVRGLKIEFRLPGIKGDVTGSVVCDLKQLQVRSARLRSDALVSGTFKAETIALELPGGAPGTLSIGRLTAGKVRVNDIRGTVVWEETVIAIDPLSGSWVKGTAGGRAHLETENPFGYAANFEIRDLDLDALTDDLNLRKKVSVDGKLAGKISIRGDLGGVRQLDGDLAADEKGGNLVIRDADFLRYLAQNTKQPMALVEAAFKEYHFDAGSVSLGMDERNLRLGVRLDGAKGKRDFEINLHDVL